MDNKDREAGEAQPSKLRVAGSSPAAPTTNSHKILEEARAVYRLFEPDPLQNPSNGDDFASSVPVNRSVDQPGVPVCVECTEGPHA